MTLGPQPQYVDGVNETYQTFVDQGRESMASSTAERDRLADKGVADDAAGPPKNRPASGHDPRQGASPQP